MAVDQGLSTAVQGPLQGRHFLLATDLAQGPGRVDADGRVAFVLQGLCQGQHRQVVAAADLSQGLGRSEADLHVLVFLHGLYQSRHCLLVTDLAQGPDRFDACPIVLVVLQNLHQGQHRQSVAADLPQGLDRPYAVGQGLLLILAAVLAAALVAQHLRERRRRRTEGTGATGATAAQHDGARLRVGAGQLLLLVLVAAEPGGHLQ
mmetsp:Transcript_93688/g.286672  ORF Transcript_93688/g.286672 Transcript_93688/m.286672 type:complete len:205 (+) Transcript_93688:258-872(+)